MKTENSPFFILLTQVVVQSIKKAYKGVLLGTSIYWISPETLWNSTIVCLLIIWHSKSNFHNLNYHTWLLWLHCTRIHRHRNEHVSQCHPYNLKQVSLNNHSNITFIGEKIKISYSELAEALKFLRASFYLLYGNSKQDWL